MILASGSSALITPGCYRAAVERFLAWGWAALAVVPTSVREPSGTRQPIYSFADHAAYAHGAAAALAALPRVKRDRLILWGHSRGGQAVIDAVTFPGDQPIAFRAAVASAPICPAKGAAPRIPLLVLIGERDGAVPVQWRRDHAARRGGTAGFEFIEIPGAGHSYWAPGAAEYDRAAARLADERLRAFLALHLP